MTRDNRQSQAPDEERIAALLGHIRSTPGQRFFKRMAAMPWHTRDLSEREQIMRLSRLLRISTVAAAFFALLWVSVSVFALSQRADTLVPPTLQLSPGNVAVSLPMTDFTAFPDLRDGDIIFFIVPNDADRSTHEFLGDTLPRPTGWRVLQATVLTINGDVVPDSDIITLETTPSSAVTLVSRVENLESIEPATVISGDSVPAGYAAVPVVLEGEVTFQVGDHVRVLASGVVLPICDDCQTGDVMPFSPEDAQVCRYLVTEKAEIIAIDSLPPAIDPVWDETVAWTIVTVAAPEKAVHPLPAIHLMSALPMTLEAWDAPDNESIPYCDEIEPLIEHRSAP